VGVAEKCGVHAMTQSREALAMMDGTTVTFSKRRGYVLSRWGIILISALFIVAIVATGLLVYKFASCAQYQQHASTHPTDGVYSGINDTNRLVIPTEPAIPVLPPFTKSPKLDVRLPRAVIPDSYNIKIIPFIYEGNFTFNGEVAVIANITETTSNITLHFNDIKIYEDTITVAEYVPRADGTYTGKNVCQEKMELMQVRICAKSRLVSLRLE
jgi:aminopeptidase N